MVTNQERKNVDEALKKICAHRLFVSSPTHTRLLTYLVEKAFAGEELNEVTIGSDLYGIDYSKDSSNGTVRSYMYKLRKKLAEYYDETGQNDTIIFDIEKGQYNLKFVSAKEIKQTNSGKTLTFHIPVKHLMAAITLLLVLSTIAVFVIHYSNSPGILWQPFFSSKSQNLVVISDHFVVNQQLSDGEEHAILYSEITNVDAFLKYSEKHPETELKTTDYTLMSKMAPFAIKPLTEWFLTNNHDFSLKLESKLTYEDVRDYNIIFIGQFKTMNLSRSLFLKNSKVFSTFGDGFKYKTSDGEQIYNTKFGQNENVEYAMVSFTSLSPGKTALYFASNNDIGVLATIRNFTNKQWLKEFTKNLPEGTGFFNALFEVSGIQRNDVSCKLVELEKVKE